MKKNYIIPNIKVAVIKESLMLDTSNGEADPDGIVLSKRGSFEDDDEDFDY